MDANASSARRPAPAADRRSRVGLRLGATLAAAALVALTASGCAAGRDAQTVNQTPAIDGTTKTVGNIGLRGLSIDAPSGATYARGTSAELSAIIVNNGQDNDTLTGISSPDAQNWGVFRSNDAFVQSQAGGNEVPTRSIVLPAGENTTFGLQSGTGSSGGTSGGEVLAITGLTKVLYPAQSVRMTFTFAKAGSVTIDVPVQLSEDLPQSTIPPVSGSGE